jgi:hypothetical protein
MGPWRRDRSVEFCYFLSRGFINVMAGPSPLVGYNTNVRHKGKLYHIQTEDSGVNHPHVITHLFADGGRIIASRKTGYASHLGAKDLQSIVKKLMQDQHKAVFIELRDCVYDEDQAEAGMLASPAVSGAHRTALSADKVPGGAPQSETVLKGAIDIDALDRAAEARLAESTVGRARGEGARRGAGRYQQTVAVKPGAAPRTPNSTSIFGTDVLRGKSLDEVILSYLSDDVGEGER